MRPNEGNMMSKVKCIQTKQIIKYIKDQILLHDVMLDQKDSTLGQLCRTIRVFNSDDLSDKYINAFIESERTEAKIVILKQILSDIEDMVQKANN